MALLFLFSSSPKGSQRVENIINSYRNKPFQNTLHNKLINNSTQNGENVEKLKGIVGESAETGTLVPITSAQWHLSGIKKFISSSLITPLQGSYPKERDVYRDLFAKAK